MVQRDFYLDEERKQCLSASWNQDWSNFRLVFQEGVICSFATRKELVAGRQFVMPDGHLLSVRLKRGFRPELELLHDGLPLPGKSENPLGQQKTVWQLALFMGVLNITAGAAAAGTDADILLSIGFGYGSIALGVAYLLVAWAARRFATFAVSAIAAVLLADMALLFVFTAMREGPSSPVSGMLLKLFLVYAFLKGIRDMKRLRALAAAKHA